MSTQAITNGDDGSPEAGDNEAPNYLAPGDQGPNKRFYYQILELPNEKKIKVRYAIMDPVDEYGDPAPVRGTVFVGEGIQEFVEKKYEEVGRQFLDRGFRLIFLDWPGQGLSDRFTDNEKRPAYIPDGDTIFDVLRVFYEKVAKPNQIGSLVLFGHSKSSNFFFRWLGDPKTAPKVEGFISSASTLAYQIPVWLTYPGGPKIPKRFLHAISSFMVWRKQGVRYAPTQHAYNEASERFAGNPLTNDPEKFKMPQKYFRAHADLLTSGLSFATTKVMMESLKKMLAPGVLESIHVPVLVFNNTGDPYSNSTKLSKVLKRLPNVREVFIEGAAHDTMSETKPRLDVAWGAIDSFLDYYIPRTEATSRPDRMVSPAVA